LIERQVRGTIARYDMLRSGDRVLVAVSGGPDSTALLALLLSLAPELRLDLHVAHLDHGWRGRASEKDAEFVRRMALRHRLPVTVGRLDPAVWRARDHRQSSREARARTLRNEFLRETALQIGARRVALGHTRDDQAESFLLRLLRGSGARGLAGIYPVVDDLFIRPLIEVRRPELIAYLRERRLSYRMDATNRDTRLARNRVRRRLLPMLTRQFNPAAVEALAHAADLLRDEDAYLDDVAQRQFTTMASHRADGVVLPRGALLELPPALQRRVLRLALAAVRGDLRRITLGHVEQTLRLLSDPHGRRTATLPDGMTIVSDGTDLKITLLGAARSAAGATDDTGPCREALCPVPGEVALQGFDLRLRASVLRRDEAPGNLKRPGGERAYLDADLLPGPLLIRPRRPGDRFVPLGGPGTRKVKSFLIDRKVPVDERGRIPLVLSGARIAWVVGHAIDDRFKVTPRTRRVLMLEKEPR
jgi:tRNA(Ile)-lysidine synthase